MTSLVEELRISVRDRRKGETGLIKFRVQADVEIISENAF